MNEISKALIMHEEQKNEENKFPLRIWYITIFIFGLFSIVFVYWLKYVQYWDISAFSLGDISAFLAALASTLAWYWFLESYILQNKELKASVKAQQGTEETLTEQTAHLKNQLKVIENQLILSKAEFQERQNEKETNKPLFFNHYVVSIDKLLFEENNVFNLNLILISKRADAKIIDIEITFSEKSQLMKKILEYENFYCVLHGFEKNETFKRQKLNISSYHSLKQIERLLAKNGIKKETDEILNAIIINIRLKIFYHSPRIGIDSDMYQFDINDKTINIKRI